GLLLVTRRGAVMDACPHGDAPELEGESTSLVPVAPAGTAQLLLEANGLAIEVSRHPEQELQLREGALGEGRDLEAVCLRHHRPARVAPALALQRRAEEEDHQREKGREDQQEEEDFQGFDRPSSTRRPRRSTFRSRSRGQESRRRE